mmetsp:Transcript_37859/g.118794  ORF Transcript_37859/g.118794 Transcript_37859/m.118794 type:complete len:315 (+) Transcript_37859:528-1472(+)
MRPSYTKTSALTGCSAQSSVHSGVWSMARLLSRDGCGRRGLCAGGGGVWRSLRGRRRRAERRARLAVASEGGDERVVQRRHEARRYSSSGEPEQEQRRGETPHVPLLARAQQPRAHHRPHVGEAVDDVRSDHPQLQHHGVRPDGGGAERRDGDHQREHGAGKEARPDEHVERVAREGEEGGLGRRSRSVGWQGALRLWRSRRPPAAASREDPDRGVWREEEDGGDSCGGGDRARRCHSGSDGDEPAAREDEARVEQQVEGGRVGAGQGQVEQRRGSHSLVSHEHGARSSQQQQRRQPKQRHRKVGLGEVVERRS